MGVEDGQQGGSTRADTFQVKYRRVGTAFTVNIGLVVLDMYYIFNSRKITMLYLVSYEIAGQLKCKYFFIKVLVFFVREMRLILFL